jgi:hypothetical protein
MRDPSSIYDKLKSACTAVLQSYGIKREHVCLHMLVSFVQTRNAVIRQEYEERGKHGVKDSVRKDIGEEYGLKESHMERVLYTHE